MAAAFGPDLRVPIVDRDTLASLIEMFGEDDMEAVIDLLDTFLTESQKQVDGMRTSFDADDMSTLHRMAHSLKSSSATFVRRAFLWRARISRRRPKIDALTAHVPSCWPS